MPERPNYRLRCAQLCMDRAGNARYGEQWVHISGRTLWVCAACAESLGKSVGIPTTAERRRAIAAREAKLQTSFLGLSE